MHSTTAEVGQVGTAAPRSEVAAGLRVLLELTNNATRLHGASDERAALRALLALRDARRLEPAESAAADRLLRALQGLDEASANRLLLTLQGRPHGLERAIPWRRQARVRRLLLFVLLAQTTAQVSRFVILPILGRRRLIGRPEYVDALLAWLPRRIVSRGSLQLCRLYLELAGTTLFTADDLQLYGLPALQPETFDAWPWPRRLVHLTGWRAAWDTYRARSNGDAEDVNPACTARTIEFRLARRGAYARLAKAGGTLARHVIRGLGYRDARVRNDGSVTARALLACALIAAAIVAWLLLAQRTRTWDAANAEFAHAVMEARP